MNALKILLDGSYSSISYEYRSNPNPVTKCGHVLVFNMMQAEYSPFGMTFFKILNNIYGEYYHIDPLSIFTVDDPRIYGIKIGFKAKSRVKPWREELEEYHAECLVYWISNLEVSK